jgi:predicted NAD-dependent protein-ADP-ribosyltransferase YbiA (DUF1768 family)
MPVPTIPHPSTSPTSALKPFYFWKPNTPGGFLSQWYPSPFTLNGETYATAEMWMMVQKARLFNDEAIATKMLATTDPKEHKDLGRQVEGFDAKVWDERMSAFRFSFVSILGLREDDDDGGGLVRWLTRVCGQTNLKS